MAFVPVGKSPNSPLAGTLIAISERGLDRAGNILAFLIGGPQPGQFTIRRLGDFDITDADLLPDGDLLLLERTYAPGRGVGMRIRRVRQSDIRPGAVVDGTRTGRGRHELPDRQHGRPGGNPQGELMLTLVSDDNFSMIQHTLLLQFALVGE